MSKLPTDLEIFESIYAEYARTFRDSSHAEPNRRSKIYVPIDVARIADRLGTDAHALFGRLYYHLDHQYGYKQDDGREVHLFAFEVAGDRHCINFPYLEGILSAHRLEDRRDRWALRLSILSLIVALGALLAQVLRLGQSP